MDRLVPHSPPPCPKRGFIGGVRDFMDKKITDFDERIVQVCEILL
ncbi:BnaAnng18130D [Brassica napus]|uniref:BnaAnng18130D protein n=1 Tax=Brassica napus TaxID=3708 RepID=A0A078JCJ4_BRANA|nr:BnaAnng18130D [Brassica napus]